MPRSDVYCDQCDKYIGEDELACLSDIEENLDFCSEDCYLNWNNEKWWEIWKENIHQGSWVKSVCARGTSKPRVSRPG